MTTALSLTWTSPSPPKLIAFQPVSDLPSNSDFQATLSFSPFAGAFLSFSPPHVREERFRARANAATPSPVALGTLMVVSLSCGSRRGYFGIIVPGLRGTRQGRRPRDPNVTP